jgi:hypothetical protein
MAGGRAGEVTVRGRKTRLLICIKNAREIATEPKGSRQTQVLGKRQSMKMIKSSSIPHLTCPGTVMVIFLPSRRCSWYKWNYIIGNFRLDWFKFATRKFTKHTTSH